MFIKYKAMGYIFSMLAMAFMLNGCVAVALVPVALNLAAEGVSVNMTGQTITENLRDVINEKNEEVKAEKRVQTPAPLPPRKPNFRKPVEQIAQMNITTPPGTIGAFFKTK